MNVNEIKEAIEKVRFVLENENHVVIDVVEERENIEETTKQLVLVVADYLARLKEPIVMVRYRLKAKSVGIRILRRAAEVDDAYITFGEYVQTQCKNIVLSMYRTREQDNMLKSNTEWHLPEGIKTEKHYFNPNKPPRIIYGSCKREGEE